MNRRIAVGALAALLVAGNLSRAADTPSKKVDVAPWNRSGSGATKVSKADPAPEQSLRAPWYKRWFGIGPDLPQAPPPVKRDPAAEAAAQRAAAEADLIRRQEVCDELRLIAFEKKDSKLEAQADQLERRAVDLYKRQTAHLPASRMIPSEDRLDRNLGTGATTTTAAANKLATPAKPDAVRTSQANAFREVNP